MPPGPLGLYEDVSTLADPPDQDVVGHYGDPYAEQRRLAAGEGTVDLGHRGVVRVTGPDRHSWLHSLVSQHVADLRAGDSTEALLLSPQGHVEHHLHLVETGDAVLAHVEPGTAAELAAFLDRMRFLLRVEVAVVDDLFVSWRPGEVEGLGTRTGFGTYLLGPRADGDVGVQAMEALRVEARRPRLGLDTDHRTLPHEVGWLVRAVHLDKGCYRGQETVARVHNLGRPPRRLLLLHLDGSDSDLPAHGTPVTLDGREVGWVGTAARHHELGPIALAMVKRQVPDDAGLLVGEQAAAIDPHEDEVPVSDARRAAEARSSLLRLPRG